MADDPTTRLEGCLERLRAGDRDASRELLEHTCGRLSQLAHVMLQGYPRLKRWAETGDVLQSAVVRLCRALEKVTPPTLADYYRLATLQIRRELLDLARHFFGPLGQGGRHHSNAGECPAGDSAPPVYERADATLDPDPLAAWREFHSQAQALPEEEQAVFDLVWYQQLTHAQAASVLGVATKTVQRRWQAACLKLHDALGGALPGV
jgi:RNA polymerase sigma-70 factor (ECF subfamily)